MQKSTDSIALALMLLTSYLICAAQASAEPSVSRPAVSETPIPLPDTWQPFVKGFTKDGEDWTCKNEEATESRGAVIQLELNQTAPIPIVARLESKPVSVADGVSSDYSLYVNIIYADGTPLWGQSSAFDPVKPEWQRVEVKVFPEKPIKMLHFYMLFRNRSGEVRFRKPTLTQYDIGATSGIFCGIPVHLGRNHTEGFEFREFHGREYYPLEGNEAGLTADMTRDSRENATLLTGVVRNVQQQDRAVVLVYVLPIPEDGDVTWHADAFHASPTHPGVEYANTRESLAGSGSLSRYPFACVTTPTLGYAIGIDPGYPAVFRAGYNSSSRELFLEYDLGFTQEHPTAALRLCHFTFEPQWGFRAALDEFYRVFPAAFTSRESRHGAWMPFAKISEVPGWEDFGFRFKEGDNEPDWDEAHDILTFRYTEPMTWWMPMPEELPRTPEAAVKEALRLAGPDSADVNAKAWLSSAFQDSAGKFALELHDTPWCNGAVWSMCSLPNLMGDCTDFKNKWNPEIVSRFYGLESPKLLDGEYIDSSEGYVTKELDYRRDHFAASATPLTFDARTGQPALFRGLISFEYAQAIARDIHGLGKLMMANATPHRLPWLTSCFDVLGTETNWNHRKKWQPMEIEEMFYLRALSKGKPYCFLMNTDFSVFTHEMTEKFMKRSLAFGIFPGFFSADASTGHYFTRPELYERDRELFKKYMPLCRSVSEAGWEPIPSLTSDSDAIVVERFGKNFHTIFNPTGDTVSFTLMLTENNLEGEFANLVTGHKLVPDQGKLNLTLAAEDVMIIEKK